MPDPGDEDLLARVALEQGEPPSDDEDELFHTIPERRSNRRAFEDRELPVDLTERLVAEARDEGVSLCVSGEERAAVAGLIAEGDRIQMADTRFRRELAAWIHPNRSRTRDGMRGYAFGFGELMSHAGPLAIRSFDLGGGQAARDRELAERSPLLAVLLTESDDPAAWLATGQALQRVLLRARAAGVWSSFMNQPIGVAELRPACAGGRQVLARPGRRKHAARVTSVVDSTPTSGPASGAAERCSGFAGERGPLLRLVRCLRVLGRRLRAWLCDGRLGRRRRGCRWRGQLAAGALGFPDLVELALGVPDAHRPDHQ